MDPHLEFPYHPRISTLLFAMLLFGLGSVFMIHVAATNTQGLLIDRTIELSPANATLFYYVIAAIAGIFVVLGLLGTIELLQAREEPILRLTPDEIILPAYLLRRDARHILYRDITHISWKRVLTQKIMMIRYSDGKRADINSAWLPSDAIYNQVVQLIASRIK